MQKVIVVALACLMILGVLAMGCVSAPPYGGEGEPGGTITGVDPPDIVVPDINDSEGEFPLPV